MRTTTSLGFAGFLATAACLLAAGPAQALELKVNFQPAASPVPAGYSVDSGLPFSTAQGYGWVRQDSLTSPAHVGVDLTDRTRDRSAVADQRLDTLLQIDDTKRTGSGSGAWEAAVPSGAYDVTVAAGDPSFSDSIHRVNVEGTQAINFAATSAARQQTSTVTVTVTDGRLTLDGVGGTNTKFDYVDIKSASAPAGSGVATIVNTDPAPSDNRMVFNRIGTLTSPPANGVHNKGTVRIRNTGTGPLTVTGLKLSSARFQLTSPPVLPATIAVGGSLTVAVKFVATSGRVSTGSLTISTDSATTPTRSISLAGYWQSLSEHDQEPTPSEIVNSLLGYKTVLFNPGQQLGRSGHVETTGEEILAPYWQRADATQPVKLVQIAAWHGQWKTSSVGYFPRGSLASTSATTVLTHSGADGQSLLPRKDGSTTLFATTTFTPPTASFGLKVDRESSDPTQNDPTFDLQAGCTAPCGHRVRAWPLRSSAGALVANTYLVTMDYYNAPAGPNYDYNDNMYVVSNITPDAR